MTKNIGYTDAFCHSTELNLADDSRVLDFQYAVSTPIQSKPETRSNIAAPFQVYRGVLALSPRRQRL